MSAPALDPNLSRGSAETANLENRFLLSALAFQRTRQLKDGAKARVNGLGHKPTYLAVLEVLANTISWSRDEPPAAG